MQKVVSSSLIIRFDKPPLIGGFCFPGGNMSPG